MKNVTVDYRKNENRNPPGRSARLFCLQCMGGDSSLVSDCRTKDCLLWPFRLGTGRVLLKTIRAYCLHCHGWPRKNGKLDPEYKDGGQGFAHQEARSCTGYDCPLFPYRPGTTPYQGCWGSKDIANFAQRGSSSGLISGQGTTEDARP